MEEPFARTIDAAKKYVVSSTPDRVDWNAELVRGDLVNAVQQLKRESRKGLLVGGVKLPLALATPLRVGPQLPARRDPMGTPLRELSRHGPARLCADPTADVYELKGKHGLAAQLEVRRSV